MMKKGRARVFDFFVVISALALTAVGALFIKRLLYGAEAKTEELIYTVSISEFDTELCGNIRPREQLISSNSKRPLGEILDIRVLPAYREVYSERDMTMLSSPVPGKSRVVLTVRGRAERDGGFLVGGIKLCVGDSVAFRASDLVFEGEIERIIP